MCFQTCDFTVFRANEYSETLYTSARMQLQMFPTAFAHDRKEKGEAMKKVFLWLYQHEHTHSTHIKSAWTRAISDNIQGHYLKKSGTSKLPDLTHISKSNRSVIVAWIILFLSLVLMQTLQKMIKAWKTVHIQL